MDTLTDLTGEENEWDNEIEGISLNKRYMGVYKSTVDGLCYNSKAITWVVHPTGVLFNDKVKIWKEDGKVVEYNSHQLIHKFPLNVQEFKIDIIPVRRTPNKRWWQWCFIY